MTYTDQFLVGLLEFFIWAKWLMILAFVLTMADLKFGIAASKFNKVPIKRSRAVRRTFDKISSYVLWIIIAYTFGQAFGQPFGIDILPIIMLLIIYGVELESIYVNYFAAKGKNVKVSFLKYFSKRADIIQFEENENDNETDT